MPLRDRATGELVPRFLFVSNLPVKNARAIVRGNERVLRARLADAKFFYDQDRKTRLENRVQRLSSVVYHGKLGSQLERVERMRLLASHVARRLEADFLRAEQAAWLSKADLLTEMVGEFPELQGIMGRYYALHDGETEEVADAIAEHYRPRYAGDALPEGNVAIAVALADKLYTLAGLFGIGQVPTGDTRSVRPAPRRAGRDSHPRSSAICRFPCTTSSTEAFAVYDRKIADAHTELTAVHPRPPGRLPAGARLFRAGGRSRAGRRIRPRRADTVRQLEAVRAFNTLPEAQSLAAANKRVVNILKQAEAKGESFADAGLESLEGACRAGALRGAQRRVAGSRCRSSRRAISPAI